MANRAIPKHYVRLVWAWAAEGIKPPAIMAGLQRVAKARGWKDPLPSERTIRTLYKKAQGLDANERREQQRFKWPQTIEELHVLDWRDSRSALDLVRFRDERGKESPTIREVKWFVRVRLAAPGLPDELADEWARRLASDDFASAAGLGTPTEDYGLETYLAYQPWRSEAGERAFNEAAARRYISRWSGKPTTGSGLMFDADDVDQEQLREHFRLRYGDDEAAEWHARTLREMIAESRARREDRDDTEAQPG